MALFGRKGPEAGPKKKDGNEPKGWNKILGWLPDGIRNLGRKEEPEQLADAANIKLDEPPVHSDADVEAAENKARVDVNRKPITRPESYFAGNYEQAFEQMLQTARALNGMEKINGLLDVVQAQAEASFDVTATLDEVQEVIDAEINDPGVKQSLLQVLQTFRHEIGPMTPDFLPKKVAKEPAGEPAAEEIKLSDEELAKYAMKAYEQGEKNEDFEALGRRLKIAENQRDTNENNPVKPPQQFINDNLALIEELTKKRNEMLIAKFGEAGKALKQKELEESKAQVSSNDENNETKMPVEVEFESLAERYESTGAYDDVYEALKRRLKIAEDQHVVNEKNPVKPPVKFIEDNEKLITDLKKAVQERLEQLFPQE